jgi:hypothetical protein
MRPLRALRHDLRHDLRDDLRHDLRDQPSSRAVAR